MSQTIRLICAVFIICTLPVISQGGSHQANLCFEREKWEYKASLYSESVSRYIKQLNKAFLSSQLINNVQYQAHCFQDHVDASVIKKSTQNKPNFLASFLVLLLLILLTKPFSTFQSTIFNILIMLYISTSGAKAQLSPIPPTCIGCPNCTITGNCSQFCPHNYYYTSGSCYFFSSMAGCTGANGLVCVSCNPNYYLSATFLCIPCSFSIPNCQTCSSPLICSTCISGYAVNSIPTTCDSCPLNIPFCTTCLNKNVCTNCVNQTYFINQTNKCQLCIKRKLGCYRCNPTTCYQCVIGYALVNTTCFSCSTIIGCGACLNSTYCTGCINTAYIFAGNTCIPCGNIFPFCQNCTSTVCTACESSFFLNIYSQCQCKKGSLIDNECIDIAGCNAAIKYRNKSYCTQCDESIFKFNTSTLICDCRNGFLLNYQCSFVYGCITMIMVNNKQTCLMCNKSRHFTVNNGQCSCEQGYFLEKGDNACYQTCGDGILFYLQCDDGNLIDGDGCTNKCTIEHNFICIGGNETTPSHCVNKLQNFQLEVQEIENVGEYNIAKFQFRIVNYIQFLHTLNWTEIFSLEIKQKHNVNSISINGNKITFMVEYFEDLEGFPAVLHLNLYEESFIYKKVISLPFVMVSQTAPLVLNEYPSQLILVILSKVLFALSIISLLLLQFAPCIHKMIALETITVLQLCNLAPFLIPGDSLTIRVFSNLSLSNGFGRQLFTNPDTSETYGTTFEHMSLPKTFTQNMLINESFLLFVVLLFFILFFWKEKIDSKQITRKIRNNIYHFVYVYFWNLVFSISMALFLTSMIALNCNNHRVYETTYNGQSYESTQKYRIVNSTVNLFSIFMVFPFITSLGFINIFAFFAQKSALRQYKNKVIRLIYKEIERLNVKNKIYVSMFLINLFMSFTLLSSFFFLDLEYKIFIYFIAGLPFALIVIIYRPYNKIIDNFGICLGQFTSIIFISGLCAKQYLRITKVPLSLKYQFYFCIGIVFLLTIFVIISINRVFITWTWYVDYIDQKNKAKKQKKSDTRKMSCERVDMRFEAPTRKDYFLNRLKFQQITVVDNPEQQRIKDRLRDNLFEKRNLQRNIRTLSDPFDPIRQALI